MVNQSATAPLPSWNEGEAKQAILEFVACATAAGEPGFVPPNERVAVFDNDGTLWCEKPLPVQADFLLRRMAEQAARDASLREQQPWKAVWEKDYDWLNGVITKHYQGDDRDLKVLAVGLLQAYAGESTEALAATADRFLRSAQNPALKRPYLHTVYAPMVELLAYLGANG